MQTRNYQPNARQGRWHDYVRDNCPRCENCNAPASDLHHILGAAAKHNKVWIGQWVVTMLCYECNHNDLKLPPKKQQIDRFVLNVVEPCWKRLKEVPMNKEELLAIMTWHL